MKESPSRIVPMLILVGVHIELLQDCREEGHTMQKIIVVILLLKFPFSPLPHKRRSGMGAAPCPFTEAI
jgi:hypothetical protein